MVSRSTQRPRHGDCPARHTSLRCLAAIADTATCQGYASSLATCIATARTAHPTVPTVASYCCTESEQLVKNCGGLVHVVDNTGYKADLLVAASIMEGLLDCHCECAARPCVCLWVHPLPPPPAPSSSPSCTLFLPLLHLTPTMNAHVSWLSCVQSRRRQIVNPQQRRRWRAAKRPARRRRRCRRRR
jgi:hypothetical protein